MRQSSGGRVLAVLLALLMLASTTLTSVLAVDGDGDGYDDEVDDCPFAYGNSTVGTVGCPDENGDGTPDSVQGTISDFQGADYANTVSTSSSRSSMSRSITVAPNGMFAAGADSGDYVHLYDAAGNQLSTLAQVVNNPRDLDFSPNGSLLAVSAYENGNDASVYVFTMNWANLSANPLVNLSANHDEDMYALIFSPDGSLLHVGGQDNKVTTYYTSNWTIMNIISTGGSPVYNIKCSPDGRFVAFTHSEELSVHWVNNGTQFFNRHNNTGYTLGLDWSPDGNWIVTGSSDNRVRVYHAQNGTLLVNITYSADVNEVAFNRAGTHLVLATSDDDPTWIIRTSDWTVEATFGYFPGGSGSGGSGRRGARDVAWSLDETKIYFSARYYGRVYTFFSTDSYLWLGGDVTGEMMQDQFREYLVSYSDFIPNHYNSTVKQVTQNQCNDYNPHAISPLLGASSSTAAGILTTPLSNYSISGMRECDQSGDILIEVPVARMPASLMIKPSSAARQCINTIGGGLSMGQIRWILSGASESTLTSGGGVHPGVVWDSIVPNDNSDGEIEWKDLHNSCANEPIHIMHRWENRSVPQMIENYIFCDHCAFPEDWYAADFERLRLVWENRNEILDGVSANDHVIGVTELRVALNSNGSVFNVPVYDNWTHGAKDAFDAGNTPIIPTVENSSSGLWPFQDDYRLVFREADLDLVRDFVAWMLSEEGQDNFDESGFVRMDPYSRVLSYDRIGINMRSILPDDDGDGIWNGDDNCMFTPSTEYDSVDEFGCSDSQRDSDGDGHMDDVDDCRDTYGLSIQPTLGCPDTDGDGWADTGDALPNEPTQWEDQDGDGFGDNTDPGANLTDACPTVYGTSIHDRYGCPDADGDGWSDEGDLFPTDGSQWADFDGDGVGDNYTWIGVVDGLRRNENGDAFPGDISQHKDRDGDGYGDNSSGFLADDCPDEAGSSNIGGLVGCPDTDGDGWADTLDAFPFDETQNSDVDNDGYGDSFSGNFPDDCPLTPADEITLVDDEGCGPSERDTDTDGVSDADDLCPNTPPDVATEVDSDGCADVERDSDGDGHFDAFDEYPDDETQSADSDGDGYPDNSSGTNGDHCPSVAGTSTHDRRGCTDTDGDGYSDPDATWSISDGADAVANIPSQWADADGDGWYDNYDDLSWMNDEMRQQASPPWPGIFMEDSHRPDRCPVDAVEGNIIYFDQGCPNGMNPMIVDDGTDGLGLNLTYTKDTGGMSGGMIALIAIVVLVIIGLGAVGAVISSRSKKKDSPSLSKSTSRIESEMAREEISAQKQEYLEPEDDPNYTVDDDGIEWWKDDDGTWWYRNDEMDDWVERPD